MEANMSKIVVPLDESDLAEEALPWAGQLARSLGLGIHLVAVFTYDEGIWIRAGVPGDASPPAIANQVGGYLESVAARADLAALDVTTEVRLGNVAKEVADIADSTGAGMIVLTSHGEGGVKRWARGSVSDELIRAVAMPVFVVRPGHPPRMRRFVAPVDGSDVAEQALTRIREIANAVGAELHILRVVNPVAEATWLGVGPAPDLGSVTEQFSESARAYLAQIAQNGEHTDVYYGRPLDAILQYAADKECDVIAMGTHGRGGVVRLALGSTADAVVRGADRPVLVIPHRAIAG
jgi:nucleotide-binding universal stress UspA family protein